MFEISTRLPNSFAFKNQQRMLVHNNPNNNFNSSISYSTSSVDPFHNRNAMNRDEIPIYCGQATSNTGGFTNSFHEANTHNNHATLSSSYSSNPRIKSSPFIYEHNGSGGSEKSNSNITILPVYYKSEVPTQTQLPTLRNHATQSANSRLSSYVNKIHVTGSQVLPPLNSMIGNSANLGVGSAQSYVNIHAHDPTNNNLHHQMQGYQRQIASMENINPSSSKSHSTNSINTNRFYKAAPKSNTQVIYNHDSDYMPTLSATENTNKISVIKSIKARQDMLMIKLKINAEQEEENNRRNDKHNCDETKKMRHENESEDLMKRNFNYLFINNNFNKNSNKANSFKKSENLSQVETNYRNTLNNTDKKLRNLKERQNSIDRLRIELNDTPLSDRSSLVTSAKFSYSKPSSGSSNMSNGHQKSILVNKTNKRIKEKKSVSFVES